MQELSHAPLPSILPRTLPWGCRRPRSTAVQNPPALRAPAEQVRGGCLGSPLSWDRGSEGEEGSGHTSSGEVDAALPRPAQPMPHHATPLAGPVPSPALLPPPPATPRCSPGARPMLSPLCVFARVPTPPGGRRTRAFTRASPRASCETQRRREPGRRCERASVPSAAMAPGVRSVSSSALYPEHPALKSWGLHRDLVSRSFLGSLVGSVPSLDHGCNYYRLLLTPK